ncbi:unnamed protein product [Microthlaspi erraticum]|uniref:Uncharacterized protein n=1 Tax=Microthlaspi erraticum TaxID=1685480 RepID=A0A6D2HHI2_9BRAS|nr:unnamed protein product [Microthlaspi erraticum]
MRKRTVDESPPLRSQDTGEPSKKIKQSPGNPISSPIVTPRRSNSTPHTFPIQSAFRRVLGDLTNTQRSSPVSTITQSQTQPTSSVPTQNTLSNGKARLNARLGIDDPNTLQSLLFDEENLQQVMKIYSFQEYDCSENDDTCSESSEDHQNTAEEAARLKEFLTFDIQKILRNQHNLQKGKEKCNEMNVTTEEKKLEYLDHGDPTYSCDKCGAIFWYDERLDKRRKSKNPKFSMCCLGGTIKLPLLKTPPKVLMDLLKGTDEKSRHFRDNIRAYNMLFAFTSLGGQVNKCIPNGRGL